MYLYGASGHCKVIIEAIQLSTSKIIKGVFDDNPLEKEILGFPVFPFNKMDIEKINELIISVGDNRIRKKIAEAISTKYATIIHPSASVSKHAIIEDGTVVMAKAIINVDVQIGKHCIVNSGAVIEHDCKIHKYVHISPNATLAGNVQVGEGTHIGLGASVIQGIKIGKWATIGAGTVVLKDVPDRAVVVGVPGKMIKDTKS